MRIMISIKTSSKSYWTIGEPAIYKRLIHLIIVCICGIYLLSLVHVLTSSTFSYMYTYISFLQSSICVNKPWCHQYNLFSNTCKLARTKINNDFYLNFGFSIWQCATCTFYVSEFLNFGTNLNSACRMNIYQIDFLFTFHYTPMSMNYGITYV